MRGSALLTVLLAAALASADDMIPAPKGEEVSGHATLNGKPVTAGVITFVSKDGKQKVTATVTDGRYRTKLPVGQYSLGIASPPPKKVDPKAPPKLSPIPAKYGDPKSAGLTVVVVEGKNNFDLDLKSP